MGALKLNAISLKLWKFSIAMIIGGLTVLVGLLSVWLYRCLFMFSELEIKQLTLLVAMILGGVTVLTGIASAVWALIVYTRSNKNKAAEIFFNVEKMFSGHIPFLLEIENSETYPRVLEALNKIESKAPTTKKDRKIFQQLDSVFRHFTTCYQIRKLRVDSKTISTSYEYYLDLFLNPDRKEIRKYIEDYFRLVDEWLIDYAKNKKDTVKSKKEEIVAKT
jgi:hypothetical protein